MKARYLFGPAILLAAVLLVGACSGASSTTTSGDGASTTVSSTVSDPVAGAPGPGGVGKVVATTDGAGTYIDITPAELAAMLEQKDFLFINTHIPYAGEIEQTDLFLPYDHAAEQVGELPADKSAKIVVYCRSDRMSRISIEAWVKAGYTNLYNLEGGFEAWEAAGHDLLRKQM